MAGLLPLWVSTIIIAHLIGCCIFFYAYWNANNFFKSAKRASNGESEPQKGDSKVTTRLPDQDLERPQILAELSWSGVGCEVKVINAAKKSLLQDSFGKVKAGECAGLMGPSGAGKTTLLDVLAQRKKGTGVSGSIKLNGGAIDSHFQLASAYVTQDDVFVAQLSALETLQFYAALTVPARVSAKDRQDRILAVLATLGLSHTKNTKARPGVRSVQVGGVLPGGISIRGLSGGEKRRLSIACSLISQPSLIFLDEPTTGLDSFAALNIMGHLSSLAKMGKTIVASIHQPRTAIFDKFDKVCLLSEGRQMFFGDPAEAVRWFGQIGYFFPAQNAEGLSDWLLDLISIGFHKPSQAGRTMRCLEDVQEAAESFKSVHLDSILDGMGGVAVDQKAEGSGQEVYIPISPDTSQGTEDLRRRKSKYISSWQRQFTILLKRCLLEQLRNPFDTALRLFLGCWIGILTGLVFYNLAPGPDGVSGRISILFFNLLVQLLMPFSYMSFYVANRRFFIADVAAGMYSPLSYYVATSVAAFPFVSMNAVLGSLTAYGLAGLRDTAHAIALNASFAALQGLAGTQLLIACVWMTSNQDIAYLFATSYATMSILLSGFYIKLKDIDLDFVRALSWVTCTKYALIGSAKLEFEGVESPSDCGIPGAVPQLGSNTTTCLESGNSVLEAYGYTLQIYVMFLAMFGFLVVLHFISFLALSKLHKSGD